MVRTVPCGWKVTRWCRCGVWTLPGEEVELSGGAVWTLGGRDPRDDGVAAVPGLVMNDGAHCCCLGERSGRAARLLQVWLYERWRLEDAEVPPVHALLVNQHTHRPMVLQKGYT